MRVTTHFLLWALKLAKAETQTSDAERASLARHAAGKKRVVEIGVWHGVTTKVLLNAMASDGILLGVDPYPKGRFGFSVQRVIARRELARVTIGTMEWQRLSGVEAARLYAARKRPPADLIFIDGDHSYEGLRGDWEAWNPLVAPQGIIALHDSCSSAERNIEGAGSVIFTRKVILPDPRFRLLETVDTLTVMARCRR
jgi:predicted O-methyltransferase YrrM